MLIPTHNRVELLIKRALASVCAQSYQNIEIVVLAHGCTDDTVRRVMELKEYDPRIRLISLRRRRTYPPTAENHWLAGPVAPLNAGLHWISGEWIARIDDDDIWTKRHLEKLLAIAIEDDAEFVSSAYSVVEGKLARIVWNDRETPPIGGTQTWLWRSYLRFMAWNPDCWRKEWNRVNDTDLADRMRKAGVRISYLPESTATIKPRPGETLIGSRAYLENATEIEDTYQF